MIAELIKRLTQCPAMAGIYPRAISLSSTYDCDRDVIMTLSWSMPSLQHKAANDNALIQKTVMSTPANQSLMLDFNMGYKALETEVLHAAWSLGAWDVSRLEKAPIPAAASAFEIGRGIASDFGVNQYVIDGSLSSIGTQACKETIEAAARKGYVTWRFTPVALCNPDRINEALKKDITLSYGAIRKDAPGKNRAPWHYPKAENTGHEHIYELGRRAK